MKSFLISDNRDTLLAMRLAGIDGIIAHEKEEILKQLNSALKDKNIGIIIITERIQDKIMDRVMEVRINENNHLIVTIPDRHGFSSKEDFITKYINESIGIKI
ncbi:V-type ATP synthase subunit F [Senegalia massiliensis]|uniref:V-type ATP synthase subunit F n=1 Tax=Senegalia massiliensis TaxID=1720316 RepID=UPI0010303049|nr:V-type ATP synthase subunit F [Senegalia massiliensis]